MEQAGGPVRTACYCPNTPHEHDTFELVDRDHLPVAAGIALQFALADADGDQAESVAAATKALMCHGAIASWNLVDEDGKPLPINKRTVLDRLTWMKGGAQVADAVIGHFVIQRAPFDSSTSDSESVTSSPNGQTTTSTSAKTRSSSSRRKSSGSSSAAPSAGPRSAASR